MAAFFKSSIREFLMTDPSKIIHALHRHIAGEVTSFQTAQHGAWEAQLPILTSSLRTVADKNENALNWGVFIEYSIPGRRKRLDCVILTDRGIIPLEFKVGASEFAGEDRWQLKVYCWNLRDFHRESRGLKIAPILVATNAPRSLRITNSSVATDSQGFVLQIQLLAAGDLAEGIETAYSHLPTGAKVPDIETWDNSQTEPTENILEAAQRIFGGHDVREIDHAHADNTEDAVRQILKIVQDAKQHKRRSICFVTGVPGAGKTLVGLRAAYSPAMKEEIGGAACFASGNIPLINVLTKALEVNRTKGKGNRRAVAHEISTPFWNVHRFAATHLNDPLSRAPRFRVVIFDEAQRVWDQDKVFNSQKKRQHRQGDFDKLPEALWNHSEPELLLDVMERHQDWCVVVALVGGGQEIHDGEAGLSEWGRALTERPNKWTIWSSPIALTGGVTMAGQTLFEGDRKNAEAIESPVLHLSVSKRALRAQRLTEWVDFVLRGQAEAAYKLFKQLNEFPIALARDIRTAKQIVRGMGRDARFGLLASSEADRLRSEGIEVSMDFRRAIDFPDWFVRTEGNINSSNQLEVAATEFECQGLELDWTGVCWGNDFVFDPEHNTWTFWRLWGTVLKPVGDLGEQSLARNVYRVLLTRAREGMVLFVPRGDPADLTRLPKYYDGTAEFLKACGIPEK